MEWAKPSGSSRTSFARAISLVEETRPLLPGVREPLRYAKNKVYWWGWPPRHR